MGEAELALQRSRSAEEYATSLRIVSEEADRLNNLVNSLLKLSNISNKATPIEIEVLAISDILKSSLEKLSFLNPDQQIELKLKDEGILILGNIHLLETAFINLMDNACKFSYNNPVKVTALEGPKGLITISITDSGIGIPESDIPKLIQPFHRANNARKIAGIGIGIPLTAKIIELHNGSLQFNSQLEKGTEVRVILPIVQK
jgi:signal transduction histidine kinase